MNTNEVNDKTEPRNGTTPKLWIVALALAALALIVWLNLQKSPVELRTAPEPTSAKTDYSGDVQRLVVQAAIANDAALVRFEQEFATIAARYQTDAVAAAENAAASVSGYKSVVKIIGHLAYDQIKGTDEAGTYLEDQVGPQLKPPVDALAADVNAVTAALDNDLQKISVQLAVDLAALGPETLPVSQRFVPSGQVQQDFDNTLKNLGINAAAIGVAVAFDIYAIANTSVVRTLSRTFLSIASRMFAKQVTKTVVAITAPMADGPLPIGDVIGIAFGLWTVYDISQLQPDFHEEVKTASANQLREIGAECDAKIRDYANARVSSFKNVQTQIGRESLKQLVN